MKLLAFILTLLFVTGMSICASAHSDGIKHATAVLKDGKGNDIGTARFSEGSGGLVRIVVDVKGLSPGQHGIHIHEKGDCTAPFTSAGDHYNPLGKHHGLDNPQGIHAGDLPNLQVAADGAGHMDVTTDRVTLAPGPATLFDIDGSSLVVHASPDDQRSDPTGNSGGRIACGTIVESA
jgi:Cu-Zn family superoxide dismutase